jgi:hypothetical protein
MSTEITLQDLLDKATVYVGAGSIVEALKKYKENETHLDVQLRNFKKQENGKSKLNEK